MKKVINGKRYDTSTAKLVGKYSKDCSVTDFPWYMEELYRKSTGEYFLYGEGNAASRYAVQSYGMWGAGSAITPMSYDDARKWAEKNLDFDEYEAEFGEVPEGDETVVLSVRVSQAARTALDRVTAKTGRSKTDILNDLLLTLK